MFTGTVSGAVIDNNKLPRPIALCQYRLDSFPDHGPTVVGGDNDAYDGRHNSTVCPYAWNETESMVSLLDETLNFLEKLIQHHLGDAVEHSLTDAGYQSSHFRICTVFEHCLSVFFFEVNRYIALHEARSPGPFAAKNIMRRCPFLLDRNLPFVSSFDRSNANLHGRFVLIRSNFVHGLAPWHALRHDLGVEQYLPNFLPGSVKRVASFDFQRANLRLPSVAKLNIVLDCSPFCAKRG
jgi:hypothetical protein